MSRRERKRTVPHPTIPLKVHIHRLFGRAVAILAFVQVGLGLTLYGSPKALFVVYALAGTLLLFLYLALEYRYKPRLGEGVAPSGARSDYYSDYSGSYLTGDRTELTHDRRSRRQSGEKSHWTRNALGAAGLFGAYKWWQKKRGKNVEISDSEYDESTVDRRHYRPPQTPGPPGSSVGPHGHGGYGTPSQPPPPVVYGGNRPPNRGSHRSRRNDETVLSPQSWEDDDDAFDEKHGNRPKQSSAWRDRIVGAGAGIAAFQGVKSIFGSGRRRKDAGGSGVSYGPPLGGNQNMVSQTDVSRVEAGQAPNSPHDPRRSHRPHRSDTVPATPSRLSGRPPSASSMSYDDDTSYAGAGRPSSGQGPNLRDSIATMGAIAGFREWNKRRRDRNERQRLDRIRQQELETEEQFNRRNSDHYPRPQDASGRRPSLSGTLLTGPEQATGSNPQQSRQSFHPNINQPPLPAAAAAFADGPQPEGFAPNAPWSAAHQHQSQQHQPYQLPPPPPGPPPPGVARPMQYQPPPPGSLAMPQGAVNPSPSNLVQEYAAQSSSYFPDGTASAATAAAATRAALAASQRRQSRSPTSRGSRSRIPGRRESTNSATLPPPGSIGLGDDTASPPVSLKMKMHADGHHVTLRRLNEEEAAAERAARRRERRSRRASSLSSADEGSSRYRRGNAMRDSSQQPITSVPPPPAISNSAVGSHRPPSELNLPPVPQMSQASEPPHGMPAAPGPADSGAIGSPGTGGQGTDLGTGTDVSAFDNNRRRRRAERARRLEASKGNKVEFS